jgi:acetamidase/formamidase
MPVHHFLCAEYPSTFGGHVTALAIAPGDTVFTQTVDADGWDAHGARLATGDNPLTGPFFVDGAEPGDTLAVHLRSLVPNRSHGFSEVAVTPGAVDPSYVRSLPASARVSWEIDTASGTARLVRSGGADVEVGVRPMLGCLGVAPAHAQVIWSGTAGRHGGNMDYRGLCAGTTVYLPVSVPGALLYLGDGHAAQGAGEIASTGIETSLDVVFTVGLRKHESIGWPRGEDEESIWTIGNARPLEQALQHATTEMLRWLSSDYGLDLATAAIILSQAVDYEVGNVCDPAFSMVCKLRKSPHLSGSAAR